MFHRIDAIEELFREWDTPDAPGCSLVIVQHGKPLYIRSYGMANIEYKRLITSKTVFGVGSVSKQFTAMAIALLARDGRLSLDDDIHQYLPEIPDYDTPITIKQLIYQTHGMRDQEELLYLAGWRRNDIRTNTDAFQLIVRQEQLNFKPGERRVYNSTGYTCLALIVERVTGQSLREFADQHMFKPLKMMHTHFHDDDTIPVENMATSYTPTKYGGFAPCTSVCYLIGTAGLYTTAEDLMLWMENFHTCRVGGKAVIQQMFTPGTLTDGRQVGYAFGNSVSKYRGLTIMKHPGSVAGYQARLTWNPEHHFMIIMLSNLSTMRPWELSRKIIDICLAEYLEPLRPEDSAWDPKITMEIPPFPTEIKCLDNAKLATYTGRFYSKELGTVYEIYQKDQHLLLRRQRFDDCVLAPLDENNFIFEGEDAWGGRITMLVEFSRTNSKIIDGFNISSPNALHISFAKMAMSSHGFLTLEPVLPS